MEGDYEFLFLYWDSIFDEVKDLILKLFVVNLNSRYLVEDVLVYFWVKNILDLDFDCDEFFG